MGDSGGHRQHQAYKRRDLHQHEFDVPRAIDVQPLGTQIFGRCTVADVPKTRYDQ